jgi:pyrroloquinoline quinone (PQQ) biosynthesis protein C
MGLALYSGQKQFIMMYFVLRIVTFALSHSSMHGYVIDPWKYVVNCVYYFSRFFNSLFVSSKYMRRNVSNAPSYLST